MVMQAAGILVSFMMLGVLAVSYWKQILAVFATAALLVFSVGVITLVALVRQI